MLGLSGNALFLLTWLAYRGGNVRAGTTRSVGLACHVRRLGLLAACS
jgi:hypothetical protein